MKNSIQIISAFFAIILLFACGKEQMNAKKMEGLWQIQEIISTDNSVVLPNDTIQQFIQFGTCDLAYTASCMGFYTVRINQIEKIDTFRYELKDDVFSVSSVKNKTINNYNMKANKLFLYKRFDMELTDSQIKLTGIDTVDVSIKLSKLF